MKYLTDVRANVLSPEWNHDESVDDEQHDENVPVHSKEVQRMDHDLPPLDLGR